MPFCFFTFKKKLRMKKTILQILFFLAFTNALNAQTTSSMWTAQGAGLLPKDHFIESICIVNSNVVWATADSTPSSPLPSTFKPKVIKTTNGGTTWRVYDMPVAVGRLAAGIFAFDSLTAYVAGNSSTAAGAQLFKTTDGGNTWSVAYTGYAGSYIVHFWDARNGFIWNRHAFAKTSDGGINWENKAVSIYTSNEGFGACSSQSACSIVGDTIRMGTSVSRMVISTDRGATWQVASLQSVPNFGSSNYIVSTAFQDGLTGITICQNPSETAFLAKSTNGGTSWSALTYPFTFGCTIDYIKGTKGTYMVSDYRGLTAYTTNGGQSWVKIDDLQANTVRFLNSQTGWAGADFLTPTKPIMYKWNGGSLLTTIIEPEDISLKIYPNPTSRYLNISYAADFKPTGLTIYDVSGKLILQQNNLSPLSQTIDLQAFASGTYVLQLKNTEGVVAAQKFVVAR
jgi:photosystem II stability/assembly factor-like uncharacterized protein